MSERPKASTAEQVTKSPLSPGVYNPREISTTRNRMTGALVSLGALYGLSLLTSPEIGMNAVNLLFGAVMAFYVADGLLGSISGKPLPMTSAILRRIGLNR